MSDKSVNMTDGRILPEVIKYSVPFAMGTIVQLLFNSADLAVVGNFSQTGTAAAAAVSAAGPITVLIVNFFKGISIGVNITLPRTIGAGDREKSEKICHSAMIISLIFGIIAAVIGFCVSGEILLKTNCPDSAFGMAERYLKIYFLGAPAMLVYNFATAILNTSGDTKRPLFYVTVAGALNVLLNLLFVCVFRMEAEGVAIATTITQYIPATLAVIALMKKNDFTRIKPAKLKIHWLETGQIVLYGIPLGITEAVTHFASIKLQSALNTYDISAIYGVNASNNVFGYFIAVAGALQTALIAFVGTNIGAGNKKRVVKCLFVITAIGTMFLGIGGNVAYLFAEPIISLFNVNDPAVAAYGAAVAGITWRFLFLYGIYAPFTGMLQAFEKTSLSMIYSLVFWVAFQIFWIDRIYPLNPTLQFLYVSNPIGLTSMIIAQGITIFIILRKYLKAEKV